jgi:hypothetical protein
LMWWTAVVLNLQPLPKPSVATFPTVIQRLDRTVYLTQSQIQTLLDWVRFLCIRRPDLVRTLLTHASNSMFNEAKRLKWMTRVVEFVASTGRSALLVDILNRFHSKAPYMLQKEKLFQWISSPQFAIPSVVKCLIFMSTRILTNLKEQNVPVEQFVNKLFKSVVVSKTLKEVAPWLSRKMPEDVVGSHCISLRNREFAQAMRETPIGRRIYTTLKFKAVVQLARFFTHYVSITKVRNVNRNDCAVCWNTQILWSLHGERRHGVCRRCFRRLRKVGHASCPVCRAKL